MARGRKTGGRGPGVKNKKTILREQALEAAATAAAQSPLNFMLNVMASPLADPKMRLDAAKAAAAYIHAKPKEVAPGDDARIVDGTTGLAGQFITLQTVDGPRAVQLWTLEDSARLSWLAVERQHGRLTPELEQELNSLERRADAEETARALGLK
jgi:hypothetical protein